MVEYIGMRNLLNAVKRSVGLRDGKLLFGFEGMMFFNTLETCRIGIEGLICFVPHYACGVLRH